MKVMCILGSPKKNGNTAAALEVLENELEQRGAEVTRVHAANLSVGGCRGCFACQQDRDAPACSQRDDMDDLYRQILESDVLVYASPVFGWSVSGQMKVVLDRHFCLLKGFGDGAKSLVDGKKTAFLVTSGGPSETNADLVTEFFRRMADLMQLKNFGTVAIPGCFSPETARAGAVEKMPTMAAAIVGS